MYLFSVCVNKELDGGVAHEEKLVAITPAVSAVWEAEAGAFLKPGHPELQWVGHGEERA